MPTPEGSFRGLTAGEISLSMMIFRDAIQYSRVKIHNKEYLPSGMQRNDIVMTPNGEIYYPKDLFKEDFSTGGLITISDTQVFMHEMVHVWQYQHGCNVKLRGIFSFNQANYRYELDQKRKLSDYGLEAQANLIADYFLLLRFGIHGSNNLFEPRYRGKANLLPLYQHVLQNFLLNPHDRKNLP